MEISLDVEWAHVIAPEASILLVEANSASNSDLFTAVNTARNAPGVSVVSMSWSGDEDYTDPTYNSYFTTPAGHNGVTFLAAAGDNGAYSNWGTNAMVVGYPAASPNVIGVGGTTLETDSFGDYLFESAWGYGSYSSEDGGGGGGLSLFAGQPAYQKGVVTQSSLNRGVPDVSMDADPNSGVPVYDTYDFGYSTPWDQIGGTSLATPMWAGVIALADQGRVLNGLGTLDGPTGTLPDLYALPASDFHDITSGSNGYLAGPGYDLATGRGSPVINRLVNDLAAANSVTDVTSTTANGTYSTGANISITVTFNIPVTVTGTPQLALNSGGIATYSSGSGTDSLTFTYTVASGQTCNQLDYAGISALTLNGGSITNNNNPVSLTLPANGSGHSLSDHTDIAILDTFVVTTTSDTTSSGSLRWAITQANTLGVAALITFSPSTFSTPQTITLAGSGLPGLTDSGGITIQGPGASLLTISGNNSYQVFSVNSSVNVQMSGLTIIQGKALDGGGISNAGSVTMTNCNFSSNQTLSVSTAAGGAIFNTGSMILNSCTLTGNSAYGSGGAISNTGVLTATNCTISGNQASSSFAEVYGGAIDNTGSLALDYSSLTGNSASCPSYGYEGVGLYNSGAVTVLYSTISRNTASPSEGEGLGGAMANDGNLTVIASTIAQNSVTGVGGGIGTSSIGVLMITNSTLSGNSVSGAGGGLYCEGLAIMTNVTVADNSSSSSGGGVFLDDDYNDACYLVLQSTLIARNNNYDIFDGSDYGLSWDIYPTDWYNLIGTIGDYYGTPFSYAFPDPSNQQVSTSNLNLAATLAYNGGPTQTYALLPKSPALGAGAPTTYDLLGDLLTYDQRGFPRIVNGAIDIGAFQTQTDPFLVTTSSDVLGPAPGQLTLRNAVNLADALNTTATIHFDSGVFGSAQNITLTNGALTLTDTAPTTVQGPGASLLTISGSTYVQTITILGSPTGGTFTLSYAGQTASLPYSVTAATIQSALQGLSTIGAGNVTVTGSSGTFTVTFINALALSPPQMLTATSALTGGTSPVVVISTTQIFILEGGITNLSGLTMTNGGGAFGAL